jgi:ribosome-associated translation inhibitor RaiA
MLLNNLVLRDKDGMPISGRQKSPAEQLSPEREAMKVRFEKANEALAKQLEKLKTKVQNTKADLENENYANFKDRQ